MRGFGLVAVLASCTHPAGPAVEAPAGSADTGPVAPAANGPTLTLLDAGAEPRRLLRYPASLPAADVTLRWSADAAAWSSGGHGFDETITHLPRTIHGSLAMTGSASARLVLAEGMLDQPATSPGITLCRGNGPCTSDVEGSAFAADLPVEVGFQLDADRIEPGPVPTDKTGLPYVPAVYVAAVFDAIPQLPRIALGLGARWQIDLRQGAERSRTSWSIESFDGSRVHLVGTRSIGLDGPRQPWTSFADRTDVHVSLDLATFAIDATIASTAEGTGGNLVESGGSESHASATVTIAPLAAPAAAP